jgi:hypothetical protein
MGFTPKECKSPEEFWELINPKNPLGKNFPQELCDKILYRGQSDSKWGLAPSALRNFEKLGRLQNIMDYRNLINENFQTLKEFLIELTYLQNMPEGVPNVNINDIFSLIKCEGIIRDSKSLRKWPMDIYERISAIAQHRGTSTCLLDWSKYSYVAAYFATIGHLLQERNLEDVANFAIWVYVPINGNHDQIEIISLSSGEENLNAQKGSFIKIIQDITSKKNKILFDTLETLCKEEELYKITLDKKYSAQIQKDLDSHYINYGVLHPADGNKATINIQNRNKYNSNLANKKSFQFYIDLTADIEVKNE